MARYWKIRILSAGLTLACSLAAAAATPVEATVALHRQKAAKLAGARKWDLALEEISLAREALHAPRRPARLPPAFLQELDALRKWYRNQMLAAQSGKADPNQVKQQYMQKRAAAAHKYGIGKPKVTAATLPPAQRDLLIAELDDATAMYHQGKGDAKQADYYRQSALLNRLSAYQALNKDAQAAEVAGRLQGLNSLNPLAYRAVGNYYQGRKEYPRAAGVWQKGIGLLESGKATLRARRGSIDADRERGFYLTEFYRELAFCFTQQGKADDARQAMQKAAQYSPGGR